jgi:hypothetical protein
MKALHRGGFCFYIRMLSVSIHADISGHRQQAATSVNKRVTGIAASQAGCHRDVVVLCAAFSRFAKHGFPFECIVIHEDASPVLRALPHSACVLDGEKICQYTHSRRDDCGEARQCKEAFAATVYRRPVSYGDAGALY